MQTLTADPDVADLASWGALDDLLNLSEFQLLHARNVCSSQ